jgi:predicted ester cyclase
VFYGFHLAGPRTARFHTVTVFPFENGKIKGERSYFDRASVLDQLGITLKYE